MCSLFLVTLKEVVTSLSDQMSNILVADISSSEDLVFSKNFFYRAPSRRRAILENYVDNALVDIRQ